MPHSIYDIELCDYRTKECQIYATCKSSDKHQKSVCNMCMLELLKITNEITFTVITKLRILKFN